MLAIDSTETFPVPLMLRWVCGQVNVVLARIQFEPWKFFSLLSVQVSTGRKMQYGCWLVRFEFSTELLDLLSLPDNRIIMMWKIMSFTRNFTDGPSHPLPLTALTLSLCILKLVSWVWLNFSLNALMRQQAEIYHGFGLTFLSMLWWGNRLKSTMSTVHASYYFLLSKKCKAVIHLYFPVILVM